MKKLFYLFFSAALLFCLTTTTACSKKTGCPVNENAHIKPNKKGKYPKKKTKSGLFPKGMR